MALDIDRYAHVPSILQRWDPRFKIVALVTYIFAVALLKTVPFSVLALFIAFLLLVASRLPFIFIVNGLQFVLVFLLPFLIVMPMTYPGEATIHFLGIPFAWEGLRIATMIVIKAVAIVMTAYSMFATTRFDISMIALQRLKCPKILVQMLLFTYRYIFVLFAEMQRMDLAMSARGFVKRANLETLKTLGNFIGTLLVRSFERTERVYKAMLSKGYTGEYHTLQNFESGFMDFLKAAVIIAAAISLYTVDAFGIFSQAQAGWY